MINILVEGSMIGYDYFDIEKYLLIFYIFYYLKLWREGKFYFRGMYLIKKVICKFIVDIIFFEIRTFIFIILYSKVLEFLIRIIR